MTAGGLCGKCGAPEGEPHEWREGDCALPHRSHSRATIGHVCSSCVDRHRDWLAEIVEMFGTLHLLLIPALSSGTTSPDGDYEKPRKAPEAPAPSRLDVLSLLNPSRINGAVQVRGDDGAITWHATYLGSALPDVVGVITGWAQTFNDAIYGTSIDEDGEEHSNHEAPKTLAGAAADLRANAERYARLPDIDTYDAELRWVRRHLRDAHGIVSPKPVGECPTLTASGAECGGKLWAHINGPLRVECGRCERVFDEPELRRLGQMLTYQKEAS